MFTKLSALAILLPVVSALRIAVPPVVTAGSVVSINCMIQAGDPTEVAFSLVGPSVNDILDPDAPVAPVVDVDIPSDVSGAGFVIVATEVDNPDKEFARTEPFVIVY